MSSFTEPVILEVTQRDKRPMRLYKGFVYEVGDKGSGRKIEVKAGFYTDLLSGPVVAKWLMNPTGRHVKADILHDFLYRTGIMPRKMADLIYLEAMGVLQVPRPKKWVIYASVRAFGWIVWGRLRRNENADQ
jgi:hypothetical protein